MERYINPNGHQYPTPVSPTDNQGGTFNITQTKSENGEVYCEFTLSNFDSSNRLTVRAISTLSQSTTYHPLIAVGNLDSSSKLIFHSILYKISSILTYINR